MQGRKIGGRSRASEVYEPSDESKLVPGRRTLVQMRYGDQESPRAGQMDSPSAKGGGSGGSLPDPLRDKMERAFNTDFSTVTVRESSEASNLGAQAFARGAELVFAPGQYDPASARGQSLIGHELAHVVQQSEGRVAPTIQGNGLAINDDAGLEAEADDMGARAARGEVVRAGGGAIDNRSTLAQLKSAGSVIQLSPQTTHWGRFLDATYTTVPGGCHMVLQFEPGANVDATKIGMTQSVRGDSGTTPVSLDPTNETRMVASGPGVGYGIDRIPERNNPIYGSRSLTSREALSDTPTSNAPSGVTPTSSTDPRGQTATYELGHRHGTTPPKNAWMEDTPTSRSLTNTVFETTAMAIEGAQAGSYYGSVRWGWERGTSGISLVPFAKVSEGVPSQNFLAAAAAWNPSTALGTLEAKNDPTQTYNEVSGAMTADYTIPRGTRVTQLRATSLSGVVYAYCRVLSGTHTGDMRYIQNTHLRDRGDGAATADLPVPDVHTLVRAQTLNEGVPGPWRYINALASGTRVVPTPSRTRTDVSELSSGAALNDDVAGPWRDTDALPPGTRVVPVTSNTRTRADGTMAVWCDVVAGPHAGKSGYLAQASVRALTLVEVEVADGASTGASGYVDRAALADERS
jgi:hypothetical protein